METTEVFSTNFSAHLEAKYIMYPDTNHFENTSFAGTEELEKVNEMEIYNIVKIMRNAFIPIIVLVGVFGNLVSTSVFASNYLRRSSSSTFLVALACADNVFLISLFVTWFDGSVDNILTSVTTCRVISYLTYVSSFLSVWFVVGFTSERYIAICHPLKAKLFCTQVRERVAVIICVVISLVLYNFASWTTDVYTSPKFTRCTYKVKFIKFLNIITWVDTVLTMLIPFTLIFLMNMRVACTAAKFHEKRSACLSPRDASKFKHRTLRSKQQMRVTRTLLLVSTTFLVLNLPSHVFKLSTLISAFLHPSNTYSIDMAQYLVQEISQIIYYASFSMNFFLYALYGKHFQKSLSFMYESLRLRMGCSDRMGYIERTSVLRSWT
ncbi:FMRFamide peptide receptor frpr-18-like [Ostrea edulis]|uniref:FMRFamide peptide receptor frpr-18-like n=1 Tax=Ostrea edulis TaxID=37623 RepID=UPI0024AFE258|nr:FMRFamide peptide receptor frpr-18-like [Ostrea edulis]